METKCFVRITNFTRKTIVQNDMKDTKYSSFISQKDIVLKNGKNENQQLQKKLYNIGSLFARDSDLVPFYGDLSQSE